MTRVYRNPKIYTFRPEKEPQSFDIPPRLIWFLLILIVAVGIVYFFLFSPYFKIKNTFIVGAGDYETEISAIVNKYLQQRSNIFLYQDDKAEKEIAENFSIFKKAQIYKGFPDALKVDLVIRDPVLICHSQNQNYYLDEEGIVFQGKNVENNLPTIEKEITFELGEKAFTKEFVSFILKLNNDFPAKTHLKIKKITISETDFAVNVYTNKGWYAIFDTTKDPEKQLDNLVLMLPVIGDQKIGYLDLRLENKIYYK